MNVLLQCYQTQGATMHFATGCTKIFLVNCLLFVCTLSDKQHGTSQGMSFANMLYNSIGATKHREQPCTSQQGAPRFFWLTACSSFVLSLINSTEHHKACLSRTCSTTALGNGNQSLVRCFFHVAIFFSLQHVRSYPRIHNASQCKSTTF